jgi:hypothetical protein
MTGESATRYDLPTTSRLFRLLVLPRRQHDCNNLARDVCGLMHRVAKAGLTDAPDPHGRGLWFTTLADATFVTVRFGGNLTVEEGAE